jgi:hypothetical protein
MDKSIGILLMVVLGVSGVLATALAWFCPALQLDKSEATLAGFIGVSFTVFQTIRFRHLSRTGSEPVSVEVKAKD